MYIPVDDMRLRPTFAKLDKESRKWAELCYAFMEDVSRDGDFLNIVDITYIMGTKLQEKVIYIYKVEECRESSYWLIYTTYFD